MSPKLIADVLGQLIIKMLALVLTLFMSTIAIFAQSSKEGPAPVQVDGGKICGIMTDSVISLLRSE